MTGMMSQKQKRQILEPHPTDWPSASAKRKTPSIPVTPKRSSLRVGFQHTPIDLTRATGSGSQKDSDNESFLSILGSSDDEEYRPLHGNRTPQGSGWPGGDAGAPVPVYGMFLRIRKK